MNDDEAGCLSLCAGFITFAISILISGISLMLGNSFLSAIGIIAIGIGLGIIVTFIFAIIL